MAVARGSAISGVIAALFVSGTLVYAVAAQMAEPPLEPARTFIDWQALWGDGSYGVKATFLVTWSFLLFGVTLVLFGTVRANGSVVGPLVILFIGLYPVRLGFAVGAYPWLKADALWLSFPVSSLSNMVLALAFYLHGGWRKSRMQMPPLGVDEAIEEAVADAEPGGRLNPSG